MFAGEAMIHGAILKLASASWEGLVRSGRAQELAQKHHLQAKNKQVVREAGSTAVGAWIGGLTGAVSKGSLARRGLIGGVGALVAGGGLRALSKMNRGEKIQRRAARGFYRDPEVRRAIAGKGQVRQ